MRNSDLIDALPDSLCVVDAYGNILQTNRHFCSKVFMHPVDSTVTSQLLNFAHDILHPEHRSKFFTAVDMVRAKGNFYDEVVHGSISLRFSKTLLKGSSKACKKMEILILGKSIMSSMRNFCYYNFTSRYPHILFIAFYN